MKIKVKPEDFVVEELIDVPFTKDGPYTVLKLTKWAWNTLDVIDFISRKLRVSAKLFSRAGLKDRYAQTTQYLSFKGKFQHTIKEKNFTVTPVATSTQPVSFRSMKGNRFSITLRNLTRTDINRIKKNYQEIIHYGIPNYFDEQRFGSAKHGQGFFAKRLMLGHYRGALQLILATPFKDDLQKEKQFKKFCREHWGEWTDCLHRAPPSYRRMVRVLAQNRRDLKGAIKTINREMLNLHILAYQSFIFNESLKKYVADCGINTVTMRYPLGSFIFYRKLVDVATRRQCTIPMVSEKASLRGEVGSIMKSVLNEEGVTIRDFSLRAMRFRGVRFKPFKRNAIIFPQGFTYGKTINDELYAKKRKMKIAFTLPPGSYATLLIKRLTLKSSMH